MTHEQQPHVIITGANSGIGKAAAIKFAAEGYRVIMACRNAERGMKAQQEVKQAAGSEAIELMQVDVSSFASIRAFCADYEKRFTRLDVLIHNAGYFEHGLKTYQLSPDGLEKTFASNTFGPLLMSQLLAGLLAKSPDARILHACSTNIKNFYEPKRTIEFDNLQGEHRESRKYSVYKMYGDSKMGLLLLTYKLAEVWQAQGIKVNALMIPATRLSPDSMKNFTGIFKFIAPLIQNLNPWKREPEEIAECYYAICATDRFKAVTGMLIDAKLNLVEPAETDGPLSPANLISEMRNTRHTPAYANRRENIEKMWQLSNEVIVR